MSQGDRNSEKANPDCLKFVPRVERKHDKDRVNPSDNDSADMFDLTAVSAANARDCDDGESNRAHGK